MINELETPTRDFKGFKQFFLPVKTGDKYVHRWVFCVLYFTDDLTMAYLYMSDGSELLVPIDSKDRVTILGKKYSPKYWKSYY